MGVANLLPSLNSISHKINIIGARRYNVPCHEITRNSNQNKNAASNSNRNPSSILDLLKMRNINHEKQNKIESDHSTTIYVNGGETDRHLRIGVDVSTWIAAACHGNGAELIDERHFSRHGRNQLAQHAAVQGSSANIAPSVVGEGKISGALHQSSSDQQEQAHNFINIATDSVLRKIKSIQYLLSPQVIVVLDGASPPIKMSVVEDRQRLRSEAAHQRDALHVDGDFSWSNSGKEITNNHADPKIRADQMEETSNIRRISSAKKAGAQTSEIYAAVLCSILKKLREHEITYLVAPYEADGQLTYLSKQKYIDLIISEDSDFIACGAEAILYKYKADIPFEAGFDKVNNSKKYSEEVFRDATATATLILPHEKTATTSTSFSLMGFTDVMFTILCVGKLLSKTFMLSFVCTFAFPLRVFCPSIAVQLLVVTMRHP